MENQKKRRTKVTRVICITIFVCIGLLLISCVSIRIWWTGGYDDCISITLFEKQHILTADKMILRCAGQPDIVVDNCFLVKRVTAATTTANRGHLKAPQIATIEIYNGDKLIRSMYWSPAKQLVQVCDAPDSTHILITQPGCESIGFVKLSSSLGPKLQEIVKEEWSYMP